MFFQLHRNFLRKQHFINMQQKSINRHNIVKRNKIFIPYIFTFNLTLIICFFQGKFENKSNRKIKQLQKTYSCKKIISNVKRSFRLLTITAALPFYPGSPDLPRRPGRNRSCRLQPSLSSPALPFLQPSRRQNNLCLHRN